MLMRTRQHGAKDVVLHLRMQLLHLPEHGNSPACTACHHAMCTHVAVWPITLPAVLNSPLLSSSS